MGANAATKLKRVVDNLEKVVAVEWFTACQGLDFRTEKSSPKIEGLKAEYRKIVPFIEEDLVMYPLMKKSIGFLREH